MAAGHVGKKGFWLAFGFELLNPSGYTRENYIRL